MSLVKEIFSINRPVVMLAPMAGVTDWPLRKIVRSFGCDLCFSEMIHGNAIVYQGGLAGALKRLEGGDWKRSAVQIAGCKPEIVEEAVNVAIESGAKLVDLNFGCPAKRVVAGYAGSHIMRDVELAKSLIKTAVKAANGQADISVKMRLGWDTSSINAPEIASIAEEEGVKMVTVHGRTRSQMFSGKANWSMVANVKNAVKIPVIVNGDIKTIDDVSEALRLSGADGVMIGRGSYGKPWLIEQIIGSLENNVIENPSIETIMQSVLKHFDDVIEHYGEKRGVFIFRQHIGWYVSGFPMASNLRGSLYSLTNYIDMKNVICNFFEMKMENCSDSATSLRTSQCH